MHLQWGRLDDIFYEMTFPVKLGQELRFINEAVKIKNVVKYNMCLSSLSSMME